MILGGGFLRPDVAGPTRTRAGQRQMDPERDKAIAAAVLQVLAEVGYRGLTMDEVALTAGVSKATIYRRWSTKRDLLVALLEVASEDCFVTSDRGSLRGDLLAFMRSVADVLQGPSGAATRAIIGQLWEEPALAEAYRAGPLMAWDRTVGEILARAVGRGEIQREVTRSVAVQAGPAILLQLWFLRGRLLDEATVAAIVDDVMLPVLAPGARDEPA
jgi:AcrR family transcriptional regulator